MEVSLGRLLRAAFVSSLRVPQYIYIYIKAPATHSQARTDAVLWSVDRQSFEACGGRSEGSMARRAALGGGLSESP